MAAGFPKGFVVAGFPKGFGGFAGGWLNVDG